MTVEARSVAGEAPMRGAAVAQRFLPDGASVVTTQAARVCLVSRRIDIAASEYRDADGAAVDFAEVVRSPATVIQAIAAADGEVSFRVQLKFSPQPGAPLFLDLPSGARDIAELIEPSTDSLLIAGDLARDLAQAFAQGESPRLRSLSRDTGRMVADRLDAPDLAALEACAATLAAAEPAAEPEPAGSVPARLVRAVFKARQGPEHVATPGQLQACGMADRPETLYLGRLQSVTGFVSHTDKVFVSYAADGAIERVYIPGIFDADLRGPAQPSLRVSRAADGNVPTAVNQVSGCIGAETMAVCQTDLGDGVHALTACPDDGLPDLFSSRDYDPGPVSTSAQPFLSTQRLPPLLSRRGPPVGGGGGTPPGAVTTSRPPSPPGDPRDPEPPVVTEELVLNMASSTPMHGDRGNPPPPPPPNVVPLPAGLWLILTGLGALGALRGARRRSA